MSQRPCRATNGIAYRCDQSTATTEWLHERLALPCCSFTRNFGGIGKTGRLGTISRPPAKANLTFFFVASPGLTGAKLVNHLAEKVAPTRRVALSNGARADANGEEISNQS